MGQRGDCSHRSHTQISTHHKFRCLRQYPLHPSLSHQVTGEITCGTQQYGGVGGAGRGGGGGCKIRLTACPAQRNLRRMLQPSVKRRRISSLDEAGGNERRVGVWTGNAKKKTLESNQAYRYIRSTWPKKPPCCRKTTASSLQYPRHKSTNTTTTTRIACRIRTRARRTLHIKRLANRNKTTTTTKNYQ